MIGALRLIKRVLSKDLKLQMYMGCLELKPFKYPRIYLKLDKLLLIFFISEIMAHMAPTFNTQIIWNTLGCHILDKH